MHVLVTHNLGSAVALSKIQYFATNLPNEYKKNIQDLKINWADQIGHFLFKVRGISIGGQVHVSDGQAVVDVQVPFAFFIIKGQIERNIKERLLQLLRTQ